MKKAAVYVRVSTLEQASEGYSIGEQKERLLAYCMAHDWVVSKIYADGGYSGANLNRPGIQNLINEIKNFDVVLVYKLDRLSRSQRDTLYLIEEIFLPNKVDFVSMQESFDTSSPFGKAMIGLLAVFAQLEREQIKERTLMGKKARAKAGFHQGALRIPLGYDYKNGKLVINPYEADIVRNIFKWYTDGLSTYAVIKKLHLLNYVAEYSYYRNTAIQYILSNPVYTGQLRYGDVIVENAHEAIISREQFEAAQYQKSKRQRTFVTNGISSEHFLTGVIFCGCCGARYVFRSVNKIYTYYSCYSKYKVSEFMVKDPNCKNRNWRADKLEDIVKSRIRELLKSPKLALEIARENRSKPVVVNNDNKLIEKRIQEIDRQINKFMELYKVDGIPPEVLGNNINKLYTEKTALEEKIEPEETVTETSLDLVEELLKDAAQVWDFADDSQKRRIMLNLVNRITLTGDKVDIEWGF